MARVELGAIALVHTSAWRWRTGIERSGVEAADGTFKNYVRLFEMDVSDATDVSRLASLAVPS